MNIKQFEKHQLKRDILSIIIVFIILLFALINTASAQTRLPDTVTIKLSQRDLFAVSQRIDSLQSLLTATSVLPANQVTSFNQRLNVALSVMYNQIRHQMIIDKPKLQKKQ